ncbi:protein-glutamine gamma-glutamyltransferase [Metabacillus sp. RGM 3146]|uniref:protein-glutamine gamma-glutamyltransferase n=1 Tax=Metabacillus sp. RGM 3146 TaxID=3401092 RepID=UPI003B9C8BC2
MILINKVLQSYDQIKSAANTNLQRETLRKMNQYEELYSYDSIEQLIFELDMRERIVRAAKDLFKSGIQFEIFENSVSNKKYWTTTPQGAFVLKRGFLPSQGIRDIFKNGSLYAFECATAMVIIFYKAALDSIDESQFNRLFEGLVLYDWHSDDDLGIHTSRGNNFLPGDVLYFNNPDFNPETPQWRGENVIDLSGGQYYGHGIGIRNAQGIIKQLNSLRRPHATQTAYLFSQVTKPDYKYLSYFQKINRRLVFLEKSAVVSKIGSNTAVY